MVFLGTRWKRATVDPPEPLRAVHHSKQALLVEVDLRAECGSSHTGEAGAALTHPLEGTDLPPPVGSPAAHNSLVCSPALAVEEKAHRSTIMPPSPIAMTRNGCDLPVLLKYNDLYFGGARPHCTEFTKSSSRVAVSNSCGALGRAETVR